MTSISAPFLPHIKAVCVTANVSEFRRVPGLRLENWP
jgi:predicted nucleic acid-binding protein